MNMDKVLDSNRKACTLILLLRIRRFHGYAPQKEAHNKERAIIEIDPSVQLKYEQRKNALVSYRRQRSPHFFSVLPQFIATNIWLVYSSFHIHKCRLVNQSRIIICAWSIRSMAC